MSDEVQWWKKERKSKSFLTKRETTVQTQNGWKNLPKNSYVNPISKKFLPYGHWALSNYNEAKVVFAETSVGFGFVDIDEIDW
jgi:hypothetical protein